MKNIFLIIVLTTTALLSCSAQENPPKVKSPNITNYSYEIIVKGIEIPWGMSFISKNDLLVTEKSGTLFRFTNGIKKRIKGLPPVYVRGQGGLLDVAISPLFEKTKEIYFTMSSEIDTYNNISLTNNAISVDSVKILIEIMQKFSKEE